ncbi:hypothetical protein U5801_06880 [Lamprobacter modestohalophilus]|uniref:hypothetical protein n=1 Tax=Lamprobacter modestohalophilus TaxID=1064514 RepID=UPI002ADEC97D|nr:hypothetical protein [Lamprobacter modestohalophilus]MEA1049527.1 hypothetical protein [Lamprobacter modestohalophilus]
MVDPRDAKLTTPGYDIIGDIHGQAAKLRRLLKLMGYVECDGVYHHPQRQVIFVADQTVPQRKKQRFGHPARQDALTMAKSSKSGHQKRGS